MWNYEVVEIMGFWLKEVEEKALNISSSTMS